MLGDTHPQALNVNVNVELNRQILPVGNGICLKQEWIIFKFSLYYIVSIRKQLCQVVIIELIIRSQAIDNRDKKMPSEGSCLEIISSHLFLKIHICLL